MSLAEWGVACSCWGSCNSADPGQLAHDAIHIHHGDVYTTHAISEASLLLTNSVIEAQRNHDGCVSSRSIKDMANLSNTQSREEAPLISTIVSMSFSSRRVAVIGAGISGVVAAAHLKKEGIEVTIFERSSAAGGIW
jgi:NADPH-dependent 2,4-dienoyl-CoA reductase/sulfur reductase-like enzyme